MHRARFLVLSLFLFQNALAQDQPILQHYSMDQGLPSDWIRAAVQDPAGFMWFATLEGLTRFDGYTFKTYNYLPKDSLGIDSDRIIDLDIDDEGFLWICRYFWPLEKFDTKTERVIRFTSDYTDLPNDCINDIYYDAPHTIWLGHCDGGGLSKLNKITGEIVNFQFEADSMGSIANQVREIHRDVLGNLWIGTWYGLYLYDSLSLTFTRHSYSNLDSVAEYYGTINEFEPGKLLLETGSGPLVFNTSSKKFESLPGFDYYSHHDFRIGLAGFSTRNNDNIWIGGSHGGLMKYHTKFKTLTRYDTKPMTPLCMDRSGNIWLHSRDRGVSSFNPEQRKFRGYQLSVINERFSDNVTAIIQDQDGFLWVGTDEGLYRLKFDSQQRIHLLQDFKNEDGPREITSIFQDSKTRVWIGALNGLYMYDPDKRNLKPLNLKFKHHERIKLDFLHQVPEVFEDLEGTIWVADNGLAKFDPVKESFIYYEDDDIGILSNIQEDPFGTWWFTNHQGLVAFEKEKKRFFTFKVPYSNNYFTTLFADKNRTLWIGAAPGLFSLKLKPLDSLVIEGVRFKNHNHLLPMDYIMAIEGHNDDLWVSYPTGLSKINTRTNEVENYDKHDGLQVQYNTSASFKNARGELYFSWGNGFNVFHPDSIEDNNYIPPVVLTDFQISNRSFGIRDSIESKPVLTQVIHETESITLPPSQTFSFEFAALDYTNPKENQYSYMLEGYDEEWSPPGTGRRATYTNLWEGNYTFRVRGSNNDGMWNMDGTSINITILPPWWRTWWAYCFYSLTIIGILWSFFRFFIIRERLKGNLKLEQVELENIKEMDQAKTQFFANISHEFRTPLTLILGPLKQMKEGTFKGDVDTVINVMVRNSQRLLRLINQLLDFTKLEAGAVSLQTSVGDLVEFTRAMFSVFESTAKTRQLDYLFQSNVSTLPAYYDREKLEKVIINLLSNAFKFTRDYSTINLRMRANVKDLVVDKGEGVVEISIEDSGMGISSDKLPHIFDRFYQTDSSYTRSQEGTGIGLALAKELVELHHGTIAVISKKGEGSTFTIHLPLGKSHLKEEELVTKKGYQSIYTTAIEALPENLTIPSIQDHQNGDLPLLLIIDDNEDMRLYLREILSGIYQVAEASNGLTGWDYALENTPDLIISDVMMPELDGHQLCERLKTDERTSHIPVVLLTARAGEEAKLEGLETGADDYITKPFSPVELRARVQNLIELRQKLREQFSKNFPLQPKDVTITSTDQQFLKRALDILEIHRSDTEFNSDAFAHEIGMSRSQLYRKLKALTDQSTGDFIRSYRLKYARQLITKGFGNVTQVAYESGFGSPSYFAECFKKQFGVLPSEFAKSKF